MAKVSKEDEIKPVMYKARVAEPFFAYQWKGQYEADTPAWIVSRSHVSSNQLHIITRTGTMGAAIGDWVTQEPDGTAAVIDNALFHATYEPEKALDEDADDYVPVIEPRQHLTYAPGYKVPDKTTWVTPEPVKAAPPPPPPPPPPAAKPAEAAKPAA
jgi:hypothetical protein